MTDIKRVASSTFLALGVLLVFFGLNAALGFTAAGAIASVAVIGALLYTGAVWLAPRPPERAAAQLATPIVFDREGRTVSGAVRGQSLSAQLPQTIRADVSQRCAAALAGIPGHIVCDYQGRPVIFEFLPVRSANGTVVYGLLVTSEAIAQPMAASA
jgi:hypothetical protein